jgi:hypothetical protein
MGKGVTAMKTQNYATGKEFIEALRETTPKRDPVSIEAAIEQIRDWLREQPEDLYVRSALEHFETMHEAALLVHERKTIQKVA